MPPFRFKQFNLTSERSAMKLGTDAVLLGASMTLDKLDRRLLDIGTGTGIIALMAAQRLSAFSNDYHIEAIDIDEPSAREASDNFNASPWKDHLEAVHCDLRAYETLNRYDLIFSNPPYFEKSLPNPDDRRASSRHTVDLSYRDIFDFAKTHLEEGGRLALILPFGCLSSLRREAVSKGFRMQRMISVRTTPSKEVSRIIAEFILPLSSGKNGAQMTTEQLTVFDNGQRSEQYRCLTEDFYL